MDKILVADDLDDVRELVVMMIEAEFDVKILEAADGEQAIQILQDNPDIAVIVSDYDMPKLNGGDVYLFNQNNLQKPFILISSLNTIEDEKFNNFSSKKENYKISKPFEHEKFTGILLQAIKQSQQNSDKPQIPNELNGQTVINSYSKMRGTKLISQKIFIADTYIKLSEGKYVKIGDMNSVLEQDQINKYIEKNIEYFYLNKAQYNDFLNNSIKDLMSKFNNVNMETTEVISLHLATIQQVQEVAKSIGVKQPIIELTDKVALTVNTALLKEKSLNAFLKNIIKKENYFFEHTNIINYLCGAMVKELGWDKDRATKRFITVSMFFDIGLSDPYLASILTQKEPAFLKLKRKEQDEILFHIKNSIEIISKSSSIIGDEFKIIEHHHEKPNGTGFPKGLNSKQIPPQSAVFILAHDFAHLLIKHGGPDKISPAQILEMLGREYTVDNFEKPYLALKSALNI